MAYDHHRNAGNQGDCVKHPPLIAALDTMLHVEKKEPFHYLDVFAGHAWHPLLAGGEYKWRNGIGRLALTNLPGDAPDSVKCWWRMWHDAPEWPTTSPPGYPGSSWIAAHRCRNAKKAAKLELYDHSEEVRRDLERAFPASHAIQDASPDICLIGQSLDPTQHKQQHIEQADFVFIDPPGWNDKDPSYPEWAKVLRHILKPRKDRPTLMWMPTAGTDRAFNGKGKPSKKIKEAADLGYEWSAVRWETAGANSACALVYNSACSACDCIREAVNCIVGIALSAGEKKWEARHSNGDR
jgi:23S rRNA A2030 N6-methylase RlmJ